MRRARCGERARACIYVTTLVMVGAGGCAHLADGSPPPAATKAGSGWVVAEGLRFRAQRDVYGCGTAALSMMLERWGHRPDPARFAALPEGQGVTAGQLRDMAKAEGLLSFVFPGTPADLAYELGHSRPVVVGLVARQWLRQYSHFVVVAGFDAAGGRWLLADPDRGWRILDHADLMAGWRAAGMVTLVAYPPPS